MKWRRAAVLTVLMLACMSVGALAATKLEKVEAFLRPDFQIIANGKKVDVGEILVYKDMTYLPAANISRAIGAEVKWEPETKSVYINSRYYGQPPQPQDKDLIYDEIRLNLPMAYVASYLGDEYPVLSNMTLDGKTYYRVSDIERMGIPTSGLRKAKDKVTEELYILPDELKKVWITEPKFTPTHELLVIGETDPEKTKVVRDFIERLPKVLEYLHQDDPDYFYIQPMYYVMDVVSEKEYRLLANESGNFVYYFVKLNQYLDSGDWYESGYSMETLGPMYEY